VAESGDGALLTTLTDAHITVQGTAALPEPVVLEAVPADWEMLEGMRVRLDAALTVIGNRDLDRAGEVDLAFGGRVFTPTDLALPGDAALALDARQLDAKALKKAGRKDDAARVAALTKPTPAAGITAEAVVALALLFAPWVGAWARRRRRGEASGGAGS